jgi:hypothetical protein
VNYLLERRVRLVAKYFVALALFLTIAWVVGRYAIGFFARAQWSPDGLDVVRIAAGLYLMKFWVEVAGSMARLFVTAFNWWTE